MKTGLVDIHQHLLWGLDDGAESQQVMRDMLKRANEQQIHRIYATPHAVPGFHPFDTALYMQRLAEAKTCASEYGIQILPGAEIAWTYHTIDALRQNHIPTLNGTEYVLLEFWPSVRWDEVETAVKQLLCADYLPILAHVERYRCFFWNLRRAEDLKQQYPVLYQVNASSVLGHSGSVHTYSAKRLLHRQLADVVASDAHNCSSRPVNLLQAYHWLKTEYGADEADQLTHFNEVNL